MFPSALSNHLLADVHLIGGRNFLDSIDLLATNYILPLGGLFIAIFTGWVMTTRLARGEIEKGAVNFHYYPVWHFLIKYVCPILVAIVFLSRSGLMRDVRQAAENTLPSKSQVHRQCPGGPVSGLVFRRTS